MLSLPVARRRNDDSDHPRGKGKPTFYFVLTVLRIYQLLLSACLKARMVHHPETEPFKKYVPPPAQWSRLSSSLYNSLLENIKISAVTMSLHLLFYKTRGSSGISSNSRDEDDHPWRHGTFRTLCKHCAALLQPRKVLFISHKRPWFRRKSSKSKSKATGISTTNPNRSVPVLQYNTIIGLKSRNAPASSSAHQGTARTVFVRSALSSTSVKPTDVPLVSSEVQLA